VIDARNTIDLVLKTQREGAIDHPHLAGAERGRPARDSKLQCQSSVSPGGNNGLTSA
jgi:hypothetical protein